MERDVILNNILNNKHNMMTTTYYLLQKNGYSGSALANKTLYFEKLIQQTRKELAHKMELERQEKKNKDLKELKDKSSAVRKVLSRKKTNPQTKELEGTENDILEGKGIHKIKIRNKSKLKINQFLICLSPK
jgi:hypothetical protein